MVVLRTQKNEIFTSLATINQWIAPNEIGSFQMDKRGRELSSSPLDEKSSIEIYKHIPKEMEIYCQKKGLQATKAVTFCKNSSDTLKKRIEVSTKPHINNGTEIHFFLSGSLIFYFNTKRSLVAFVIEEGNWLFIHQDTEHWIKTTNDNYFSIASYHSAPMHEFHQAKVYTNTQPENSLL